MFKAFTHSIVPTTLDSSKSVSLSRIVRDGAYNVAGEGLPMIVMMAAFPVVWQRLGAARFGLFSLIWAVLGSVGVINLGLPRAVTKFLAESRQDGSAKDTCRFIWCALLIGSALGIVLGILLFGFREVVVRSLKIPDYLAPEARRALIQISIGVPITILFHNVRAILEGYRAFAHLNTVRVCTETAGFAVVALLAGLGMGLGPMFAAFISVRALASILLLVTCFKLVPQLKEGPTIGIEIFARLLKYGLWISVSDLIAPLLAYSDRFILSALLSVSAVAYLAVPREIVARIWILPISAVGAVFPVFSCLGKDTSGNRELLYIRVLKGLVLVTVPMILVLFFCGKKLFALWLGKGLSAHSISVFRILLGGVLISIPAWVTTSLLRGVGKPGIVAILQMIEAPLYLVGMWWMVKWAGIEGAALAWSGRWIVHGALLLYAAVKVDVLPLSQLINGDVSKLLLVIGATLLLTAVTAEFASGSAEYLMLLACLTAFVISMWAWVLSQGERDMIQRRFLKLVESYG